MQYMAAGTGQCHDHGHPGHVCNHAPSSVAESLDEIEFSRSIHAACIANNLDRVRSILSKSSNRGGEAPANALDSAGYTALHYASRAGNKDICLLLLNAGADVDATTPELGATPLMRAVQQTHLEVARLLVSYGASLEATNSDQENVFHILAIGAWNRSQAGGEQDLGPFVEMAKWLRTKAQAPGRKGRLESMLRMQDVRSQRPVDHLLQEPTLTSRAELNTLVEILTETQS
ncbi:Ankyrin repeat domain-containing protein 39 [Haplosporangium sp. Z 11]|nr:Ankyrin repeat domain-containing protein 39 [Haplosporangium sp. Z 11]